MKTQTSGMMAGVVLAMVSSIGWASGGGTGHVGEVGDASLLSFLSLVMVGEAVLFVAISVPMLLRRVPMNPTYGVRFAKSFSSEENWYKINEYGAKQLIGWSVVLAAVGLVMFVFGATLALGGWECLAVFLGGHVFIAVPLVQTWLYARRL